MEKLFNDLNTFAKEFAWAPAIIDNSSTYSFHVLKLLVDKASQKLIEERIDSTKRVALMFSDSALHLVTSLATLRMGACQLSLDPKDSLKQSNKILEDCGIDVLISDKLFPELQVKQLTLTNPELQAAQTNEPIESIGIDTQRIALLNIGSGTSGEAKIIPVSFEQLASIIYQRKDLLGVRQGDRFLSLAGFNSHVGKLRTLFALSRGLTNVFLDRIDTQLPLIIDRLAIKFLYATDAHAGLLLRMIDSQTSPLFPVGEPRFPFLKALIVSGSPLTAERVAKLKNQLSQNLNLIYATNETSVVTMADPELLKHKPDSVGLPIPECLVEIVDSKKQVVKTGEVGHIRIQTKGMVQCYENNPAATEAAFVDSWFYPKDLGRLDEDGVLYFEGRSDDLIFFDGVNIFPSEIESILAKLADVEESAAFPVSQKGKTVPAVCIQLTSESSLKIDQTGLEYLSNYLREEMGWKRPRLIRIVSELPRNKRGKIEKFKLREFMENEQHA